MIILIYVTSDTHFCHDKPFIYKERGFNNIDEMNSVIIENWNKLIKPNGAILLFGAEPFSSALRMSNIKNYKYDWVWEKPQGVNPLLAKKQPLNNIEYIHYNRIDN